MEALPDWDLLAVVRSCRTTTSPPSQTPLPPLQREQQLSFSPTSVSSSPCSTSGMMFRFPNPFESTTTSFHQDVCKLPLICSSTGSSSCTTTVVNNQSSLSSPVSVSSSSSNFIAGKSFSIGEQTHLRRPSSSSSQVVFGGPSATGVSQSQVQRTKKRKNMMKKVCHVPAEGLSTDMWAWRKYGQKPIKGSPYPRGYYRCSSSKGCLARKQVERNRSDPKMFIITYTAEHNHPMPTHRNSLAGSTRQKPLSSPTGDSLSPLTEKTDAVDLLKEEEDNEMDISELMLNDDFYVGFEQIGGGGGDDDSGGDCFSDQFSPPMEMPWLSSSSSGTATAAGGN